LTGLVGGTVGWARTTDLLFHRQAL